MKQATTTVLKHKDVKGKELLYLKITNGKEEVLVNVGEKTYNAVLKLQVEDKVQPKEPPQKTGKEGSQ